jgi:hypothetical protein
MHVVQPSYSPLVTMIGSVDNVDPLSVALDHDPFLYVRFFLGGGWVGEWW